MSPDQDLDAVADSSPASQEPSPSAPAPSSPEPPGSDPGKLPPFHTHPRFRELVGENRTLKETVGQLSQRIEQLEALQQQAATQGGLTVDEQRQYAEAATALKRIFALDPELRSLLEARQYLPQLAEGYESVQRLSQAQAQAQRESARSHIAQLATKEGFPTDKKWLSHLTRLVAGAAMSIPDGNARYERGDFSVLDEAFNEVKEQFFALMRREAAGVVQQTKDKTKKLPPAPRGSAPGAPAPVQLEPGKEREFMRDLHRRGLALLKERQAE